MTENPVILPGLRATNTGTQSNWLQVWRVGQVLHATVLASDQGGRASLRIGGQIIPVQSRVPLDAGMSLRVQVQQLEPNPVLKAFPAEPSAAGAVGILRPLVRRLLPQQTQIASILLSALRGAPGTGRNYAADPSIRQALQSIGSQVPEHKQVFGAAGLRRAMDDSGLLHEARQHRAQGASSAVENRPDLKSALLQLLRLLPARASQVGENPPPVPSPAQSPKDPPTVPGSGAAPQPRQYLLGLTPGGEEELLAALHRDVDGALARLTLHQTASLEASREHQALRWLLEIPVKHPEGLDILPLHVEQEHRKCNDGDEDRWTVTLALDLPGLGPLHARISVRGERVATLFWAEQETTAQRVERNMGQLKQAFTEKGLQVGTLGCRTGKPPAPTEHPISSGLVSEQV